MNVSHTASWCPWLLGFSHWLQPTGDSGLQGSHHHISSSPHQLSLWRCSQSTIYHTFSWGGCSSGGWASHLLSGRLVVRSLAPQSACQISQNYSWKALKGIDNSEWVNVASCIKSFECSSRVEKHYVRIHLPFKTQTFQPKAKTLNSIHIRYAVNAAKGKNVNCNTSSLDHVCTKPHCILAYSC